MTRRRKLALAATGAATTLLGLSAISVSSARAVGATATLNILVEIVNALEITINTSLDFGVLALRDTRVGTVTLDPLTEKLLIDTNGSLSSAGGVPKAGKIQVRGITRPVSVSMENPTIKLTNGSTQITISNFNFISNNGGPQVTVTPSYAGRTATLAVGATVKTKAGQLEGTYVGANRIFASYQ